MASFLSIHDPSFSQNRIKGMRKLPVILVVWSETVITAHYSRSGNIRSRHLVRVPNFTFLSYTLFSLFWILVNQSPGSQSGCLVPHHCQPQGSRRDLTRIFEEKNSTAQGSLKDSCLGCSRGMIQNTSQCIWSQGLSHNAHSSINPGSRFTQSPRQDLTTMPLTVAAK